MMNDKNNGKSSKSFRKEGLYVILFVCLCIAATAAAITSRNRKIAKKQAINKQQVESQKQITKETKPEITLVDDSANGDREYENSLEVKTNRTTTNNSKEVKVSKNVNTKMLKPVEGTLAREYSEVPVHWDSLGTAVPNFGIDIKAELGKQVVAVSDGIVVEVGDNKNGFGKQVVIDHQNGLKSVYANLSKDMTVKKGQKMKQGEKVGEVGNTSLKSFNEKYGSNLHLEILKDDKNVNPSKYVKY